MKTNSFISLGLGVQSTALYFMSSMSQLPRAEAAIFVDLGREKKGTYEYLEFILRWQRENSGIPIVVVQKKNLFKDLLNNINSTGQRFSSIPAYTHTPGSKQEGMLRRQCTNEYKIEQVDGAIREYLGKSNLRGEEVHVWKGITIDEWDRMSEPEQHWKQHVYPFTGYTVRRTGTKTTESSRIDWGRQMSRQDVTAWFISNGLPVPPKSSCVFCPYQSEAAWLEMKTYQPEDFEDACKVDDAIRDSSAKGNSFQVYLHDSLVPLREVNFSKNELWKGECSGNCHI